jgi:phage antirepressor YoqD-like protein
LTTKELSELTGLSSRKVNSWFTDNKLMYKKDEDWITTKRGKEVGGIEKDGQYGKFIIWPENIAKELTK